MRLAVAFLLMFSSCKTTPQIPAMVDNLIQKDGYPLSLCMEFKDLGKDAIPYLIDAIDINTQGVVAFDNPASSRVYPIAINYKGLKAAYMVEVLLADTSNVKIYYWGVVVKAEIGVPRMEALSLSDIRKVKGIYKGWWDRNKSKSFSELTRA